MSDSTTTTSARTILLCTSAAPSQTPFSTTEKRPPLGIGFLIAVLRRAGHRTLFIDNYLAPSDFLETGYLAREKVDYVGIYANTICFRDTLRMFYRLEYLRRTGQWKGKIIVGGPHTTVCPETIPDFVDFVVQGEGEQAILDIVEERATERIVRRDRMTDLDELPRPAWDCFMDKPYQWDGDFFAQGPVFTMNTSRGCPFRCSFCSVCSIWGRKYSAFSPERVVDDIEYLMKTYGARGIYFREDNFTLNKNRLSAFCELMIQRNLRIPWACESRVNTLTRESVALMARAGACGYYFGVESGSQRLLDFFRKDITVEQIRNAFSWCHEFKIRTAASVIFGIPTETDEDRKASLALINEIKPTMTWYNVFTGIPRSDLYDYTIQNRLHEFIDDRGIVYLKGHSERVRLFYGGRWDAETPVRLDVRGKIDRPAVSVIMSVHNGAAYLEQAISSVLRQSFCDFEYIIVDDASTDGTAAILAGIDDPRIVLLKNESRLGLTRSLNRAAALARGEFLARMDADDVSLPHRLATEVAYLKAHPRCAAVGSSFYVIDAQGKTAQLVRVLTSDEQIREGLKKQNWLCHGSVLMRKDAFVQAGGYDESFTYAQDYDLWVRLATTHELANIDEPLYSWRNTAGCISSAKKDEQAAFAAKAREKAASLVPLPSAAARADSPKRAFPEIAPRETVAGLVSVIMPTFNRPTMLCRALDSALAQTWRDVEIIVVNDAGEPCEEVVKQRNTRENVTYIRHARNSGLGAARNTGLRAARGQFVCYLDDDDIMHPDHVETLASFLTTSGCSVAYTDAHCTSEVSDGAGGYRAVKRELPYSIDFDADRILVQNFMPVNCIMHRRTCVEETGGFDESFATHEDWDLWVRISRKHHFHHLKKITCEFTVREGATQMTRSRHLSFVQTAEEIFRRYTHTARNRAAVEDLQRRALAARWADAHNKKVMQEYASIGAFMDAVIRMVESGDLAGAVSRYDTGRPQFPSFLEEMKKFDELMAGIKSRARSQVPAP